MSITCYDLATCCHIQCVLHDCHCTTMKLGLRSDILMTFQAIILNVITLHVCLVEVKLISYGRGKHTSDHNAKTNPFRWAVHVAFKSDNEWRYTTSNYHASNLAKEIGLSNIGQIGELKNHYLFEWSLSTKVHSNSSVINPVIKQYRMCIQAQFVKRPVLHNCDRTFMRIVIEFEKAYHENAHIIWFERQVPHVRQKRTITFEDPMYPFQWHLNNERLLHMDINVTGVWELGITGSGITVAVVDDGVEWTNPDIKDNYNQEASWDLNDDDADAMPNLIYEKNQHGTRCAGEIAAVPNGFCAVGVAYGAKVSGIKVLDGPLTDSLEAAAFNKNMDLNDIYSCSWGPEDDGVTVDGPHYLASKALIHGIEMGRRGYGSIFVVASGNGGVNTDNCNYDGYANSPYTVTIGAVDEHGNMPYYAEECASMLAVTFSSGQGDSRPIVTTDWTAHGATGCTDHHSGTSAAAPIAAGMIALMLQANPCLTWRDVQYLIIMTAKKIDVDHAAWYTNQAGLHHSHKHGFGAMDAWRLINSAKVWKNVPWMTVFTGDVLNVNEPIAKSPSRLIVNYTVTPQTLEGYALLMLEHVQVRVTLSHPKRGELDVQLICPSGTISVIGPPRSKDVSDKGLSSWPFSTARCWGENPAGTWKLVIVDINGKEVTLGKLVSWQVILYGTPITATLFQERM
ncbi:PREDICTED: proprotein convertase subtilisin/kexin type 7-like, partial [Priapulus caudatus]|uniref:Proprotein convertase subtilisin/kexin type 7-like n=1 Tax=Priapulus caudatus TaxID=37621 RepID=A0ABM1DYN8_PRICU